MSLAEIEQLLYREIGLDVTSIGPHAITKAIDTRMQQCQTSDLKKYWRILKNDTGELRELIDEVVIPETWFFRNSDPFKMLARFAHDEWLPREASTPLRILSIPCATGEEPYSISISLIEAGFTPSQFHIDAFDISKRNIELCRAGHYRDYSFRDVDPSIRDRFFRKRDNRYELDILVKATVNFRQASLLDPNLALTHTPYDVVFCRNLLIYFDQKTQQEARQMLGRLLKKDGILFVGHAETGGFIKDWFTSQRYPKAFALRKTREAPTTKTRRKTSQRRNNSRSMSKTLSAKDFAARQTTPVKAFTRTKTINTARDTASSDIQQALHQAETLANDGKFIEAEAICLQQLQFDRQNARAYYLLAMVQLASGHPQTAMDYLKKVVYLEPNNVEALMFLATLTAEQGDPQLAHRYRERAERAKQRTESTVVH